MPRVLIIDKDPIIGPALARHLSAGGFDPVVVPDGETGLDHLRFKHPDVCLLELLLPDWDGWQLLETVRKEGIRTPVVVASARGAELDRVKSLELGAVDYLVKPFGMRELVARVAAAARRAPREHVELRGESVEIEELRVDARSVQAFVDGANAGLTGTEFRLLYVLARETGRVVMREELLQAIWRRGGDGRVLDNVVRRVRRKIDERASSHTFIQTRVGLGYELNPISKTESGSDGRAYSRSASRV